MQPGPSPSPHHWGPEPPPCQAFNKAPVSKQSSSPRSPNTWGGGKWGACSKRNWGPLRGEGLKSRARMSLGRWRSGSPHPQGAVLGVRRLWSRGCGHSLRGYKGSPELREPGPKGGGESGGTQPITSSQTSCHPRKCRCSGSAQNPPSALPGDRSWECGTSR